MQLKTTFASSRLQQHLNKDQVCQVQDLESPLKDSSELEISFSSLDRHEVSNISCDFGLTCHLSAHLTLLDIASDISLNLGSPHTARHHTLQHDTLFGWRCAWKNVLQTLQHINVDQCSPSLNGGAPEVLCFRCYITQEDLRYTTRFCRQGFLSKLLTELSYTALQASKGWPHLGQPALITAPWSEGSEPRIRPFQRHEPSGAHIQKPVPLQLIPYTTWTHESAHKHPCVISAVPDQRWKNDASQLPQMPKPAC
eukprot:1149267-Pelagomonas_calceolata.AAC.8